MGSEFREQLKGTYHDYEKEYGQDTPVLYQAINPLSVGSVVVGVFSALAFFHWGFLFLPVIGILMGIAGLVNLARVEGARVGVYLSCTGIALSLLLGGGLYAFSVYRYYHMVPTGYLLIDYSVLESDDPNKPFPESAFELEGERIFIRGYMYPTRSQTGLRSFVMSRDNGVCPYCLPNPKLTDQVFVELIGGREATYTTRLIGVGGIFSMKFKDPKKKYGGIVYHIEADYLRQPWSAHSAYRPLFPRLFGPRSFSM